jgi:hypothetical protein
MTRILTWMLLVGLIGAAGCGGSNPPPNTAPLTAEQKAAILSEDQRIDKEERSGSGTATPRKRR